MKKPEKPYMVIDGDDAFPDFGNPEWVEKILTRAKKQAAECSHPKRGQQADKIKLPSAPARR